MAQRIIRTEDDEILRKKSKKVKEIDANIIELLDDMYETMVSSDGVGIAAVQVGVLKDVIIVEVEEEDEFIAIEMINPEIIESSEETQNILEGCLSLPKMSGYVTRPAKIKVKYLDREGNEHIDEYEGLGAVVVCHEVDHLFGILYTDKATDIKRED